MTAFLSMHAEEIRTKELGELEHELANLSGGGPATLVSIPRDVIPTLVELARAEWDRRHGREDQG